MIFWKIISLKINTPSVQWFGLRCKSSDLGVCKGLEAKNMGIWGILQGFGACFWTFFAKKITFDCARVWGILQGFGECARVWGTVRGFGVLCEGLGYSARVWGTVQGFGVLCKGLGYSARVWVKI